ncbi:unnamed protein product [Albugo candida]|uniref:Uncharacterized protein n=1 Tax=Albugo candida TaxID=65357 RepID=A0A024FTC6_9STRA|nr:unnamed protein product [Albugo candida]|eukprot:CCI10157.1 unnamed protein product [Albugo candida]
MDAKSKNECDLIRDGTLHATSFAHFTRAPDVLQSLRSASFPHRPIEKELEPCAHLRLHRSNEKWISKCLHFSRIRALPLGGSEPHNKNFSKKELPNEVMKQASYSAISIGLKAYTISYHDS